MTLGFAKNFFRGETGLYGGQIELSIKKSCRAIFKCVGELYTQGREKLLKSVKGEEALYGFEIWINGVHIRFVGAVDGTDSYFDIIE